MSIVERERTGPKRRRKRRNERRRRGRRRGKREGKMKTRRRRPRQVIQKALVRRGVRVREC